MLVACLSASPGVFLTRSQTLPNIIRPGQAGKYRIDRLNVIKPTVRVIGELQGYEIVEMDSPAETTSLGKLMSVDSRGFIWFMESREDKEISVDPQTLEMTIYQLPVGTGPYSIDIDARDVHWIAAYGVEMLVEAHPRQGYCLAHRPPTRGFLNHLRVHWPTNTVWFSQPGANQIVSFHPERGFKEFPCPSPQAGPGRLDVDQQGNVWVPQMYTSQLAKLDNATGQWQQWDLPTEDALPAFCRVSSDGGVWVSETAVDKIAYFKDGKFKEYQVPTVGSVTSTNITDSDGRLWFTEGGWRGSASGNKIAVLDPVTGNVSEFLLPNKNAQPLGLLLDQTGAIWFEQCTVGEICRAVKSRTTARPQTR
jgi:streptogramin lyase